MGWRSHKWFVHSLVYSMAQRILIKFVHNKSIGSEWTFDILHILHDHNKQLYYVFNLCTSLWDIICRCFWYHFNSTKWNSIIIAVFITKKIMYDNVPMRSCTLSSNHCVAKNPENVTLCCIQSIIDMTHHHKWQAVWGNN